jgi:hypothetical protein
VCIFVDVNKLSDVVFDAGVWAIGVFSTRELIYGWLIYLYTFRKYFLFVYKKRSFSLMEKRSFVFFLLYRIRRSLLWCWGVSHSSSFYLRNTLLVAHVLIYVSSVVSVYVYKKIFSSYGEKIFSTSVVIKGLVNYCTGVWAIYNFIPYLNNNLTI